jgi:UDPglucose--hexose-1-phosphate uridylyltransferase
MHRKEFTKPDGRRMVLYSRRPIRDDIKPTNPPHDPVVGGSHLRWHPLRGEWVAYASHRQNRTFLPPKDFSPLAVTKSPEYPTEMPAGDYDVAVFENLFPSLSESATTAPELSVPTEPGKGVCEVVVFTQDPETSLASLPIEEIAFILSVFADRTKELADRGVVEYVLPFENRGVEVGVTLHHPHGQLYAYPFVPPLPQKMTEMQQAHFTKHKRSALEAMIEDELKDGRRLICQEEKAVAFIPICARYTYETWIVPKRKVAYFHELDKEEMFQLAKTLKTVLMKYDAMWSKPFPYLQLMFQAPTDGKAHPEWHAHIEIYPPYRTKDRFFFFSCS